TEISVTASLTPPAGAVFSRADSINAQATHSSFLYVTISTSQDLPAHFIDHVELRGTIPNDQERYHADLFGMEQNVGTYLGVMPGQYLDGVATFDEVADGTVLQAGQQYTMRFTGVDEKTMPLKIVNDSGIGPCYVFITGRNPDVHKVDPYF